MKEQDTKSYFSFMIIPPSGKQSFSFRIKKKLIIFFLIFIVISGAALGTGLYLSLHTNVQQNEFHALQDEAHLKQAQFEELNTQLDTLKKDFTKILEREEEFHLLMGDVKLNSVSYKRYLRKLRRKKKKLVHRFEQTYDSIQSDSMPDQIISKLQFLQSIINEAKLTFSQLLDKANQYKTRFASTPSIRPLFGRIHSSYGWRYHPILRRRKFHKGIDISSWTGAPIQATADGIVEYSGWSGSFGYVVVLDHDFGYRTIYAHCSQLLVKKNALIRKGQVIAQVGSTGISTGPHLHYEIRKWRQATSPLPFLDLDMFTASTKIW